MNAQVLRQSWQVLNHNRSWLLWTCLLLALLVVIGAAWASTSNPLRVHVAAYLIGMAASFAWALVVPRLLLWQRTMRQMRAPRIGPVLAGSIALYLALLPGLPLLALLLVAKPDALALAMLSFACLAGLHWATGPLWLASTTPAALFGGMQFLIAGSNPAVVPLLWALDVLLVIYAVVRWRGLLVLDTSTLPCRKLPLILRIADGNVLAPQSILRTLEARQSLGRLSRPLMPAEDSGNHVWILRIWLGQPFVPQRTRVQMLKYAIYGLMAGAALVIAAMLHWPAWALWIGVWLIVPAFIVISFQGQSRLFVLFTLKRGGEVAELSMLPGLGTAANARHTLLRASLGPVARLIGLYTAGLMLLALLLAAPARITLGLLALGIASMFWFACAALKVLAQRADDRFDMRRIVPRLALQIPILALAMLTLMQGSGITAGMFGTAPDAWITRTLLVAWALLGAFMVTRVVRDWRLFQRRPHPFLQR